MAEGVPAWNEKTGVPKWLWNNGIGKGDWQHAVKSQYRSLMRPSFPLKVRVWAYGMLHTNAYQSEQAVTLDNGKRRPIKPQDVQKDLHREATAYYRSAGITDNLDKLEESRQNIRRAFEALEADGVHERRRAEDGRPLRELSKKECQGLYGGRKAPQVHYFFWIEPRQATPESVREEYQDRLEKLAQEKAERVVTPRLLFKADQIRTIRSVSKAFGLEDEPFFQLSTETTPEQVEKILQAIEQAKDILLMKCLEQGEVQESPEIELPAGASVTTETTRDDTRLEPAAGSNSGAEFDERSQASNEQPVTAPETSESSESEHRKELRQLLVARAYSFDDESIDAIGTRLNGTPIERFQIALDDRMTRGRPGYPAIVKLAESTRKNFETSQSLMNSRAEDNQEDDYRRRTEEIFKARRILVNRARSSTQDIQWAESVMREAS